ncbi:uncharacterized protein LOC132546961 [Ylistrum balloti]|uniref:uncharacterized protein LOC132546961 n=1 Tax=Ylistrum balloti TaxID=509963 RepID=UPI002905EC9D|nr:uncharacterized protein LOC132546961 [Ylistrum balloti]XP_060066675.1 uncharacterized protein LOC132546961 [Ylistrum balloti]
MTFYQAANGLDEVNRSQSDRGGMDYSQTLVSSPAGADTDTILTTILKEVRDIKQSLRKIDHLQTTILSVQQGLGSLNERVEQFSTVLSPAYEQVNNNRQGRQLEEGNQEQSRKLDNQLKKASLDHKSLHAVRSPVSEVPSSPVQYSRSNSKVENGLPDTEVLPSGYKRNSENRERQSEGVVTETRTPSQETSFSLESQISQGSLNGTSPRHRSSRQDTTTTEESTMGSVSPSTESLQRNSHINSPSTVGRSNSRTSTTVEYQSPSAEGLRHATGHKADNEGSDRQLKTPSNGNTSLESKSVDFDGFKVNVTPRKEDNRFTYHKIHVGEVEEASVIEVETEEPVTVDVIDPVTSSQSQKEEEETLDQDPEQERSLTETVQPTPSPEPVQVETESSSQGTEPGLPLEETVTMETPVKVTETIATVSPIIATPSETAEEGDTDDSTSGPLPKERQFLESLTLKEAQRAADCRDPKSDGADTIICVDTSDSMKGAPIQQARDFINNFLDGIEECAVDHALEENIAIVTFGKTTAVMQHLTNDYSKIREIVDEMEIEGASPIMTGLVLCMSAIYIRGGVVSFRNRKIMPRILLVSDGHVTDARIMDGPDVIHPQGMSEEEAKQQLIEFTDRLKSEHRKVTCIPVGDADMTVLEHIAHTTGGEVAKVEEAGRLSKQFLLDTIVARVMTDEAIGKPDFGRQTMERIVRDSTTGKDLSTEEMNVVFDKVMTELKDNPGGRDGAGGEEGPLPVGTRVRRGRDWVWDDQDDNMAGTIIGHKQRGFVSVEWDSGRKGKYRMGAEDSFDLRSVDEPRFLPEGMLGAVGVCCRRGPDWEWDNQDGGEDQVGVVFKIEDNGVIHVRWQNGKRGNYRYGIHGKFDIEMCPGRRPAQSGASSDAQGSASIQVTKTRPQWQWEIEPGTWIHHSNQASSRIEDLYQKRGRGTTLVEIDGQSYRVVIQNRKQRNTSSGVENTIRRQEIPQT